MAQKGKQQPSHALPKEACLYIQKAVRTFIHILRFRCRELHLRFDPTRALLDDSNIHAETCDEYVVTCDTEGKKKANKKWKGRNDEKEALFFFFIHPTSPNYSSGYCTHSMCLTLSVSVDTVVSIIQAQDMSNIQAQDR